MTDVVTLLPCPFCGSNSLTIGESEYCGDYFSPSATIECSDCACGMYLDGTNVKDTVKDIVTDWNTRSLT
jgi:Lar family restriction alleviation protein